MRRKGSGTTCWPCTGPCKVSEPRLLVVTSGLRLGGAETFLADLLARMPGEPSRFAILSLTEPTPLAARIAASGVAVASLGLPDPGAALGAVAAGRRFAATQAPDVIMGWMYHGALAGSALARRIGVPEAWSIHGSLDDWSVHRLHTRLTIRLAGLRSRRAAAICYASARAQRQHEALGYRGRSVVIPTGVDPARYLPSPDERRRRRGVIGVAPDVMVIGHVGRWHAVKDQATLIAGVGEAFRRGVPGHVLLLGTGLDRGNTALARRLHAAGLGARATCLGPRDDVSAWLAACDVVVLSSRAESSPLSVLEAMATEVPCVVTDVGGCADLVGDTGVVVPVARPEAIADALVEVFHAGADGRAAMGRRARLRVLARYTVDLAAARYHRLIRETAGARDGQVPQPLPSPP